MSCTYKIVSILDGFLCLFVFFPLAIFHWRGTWGLQVIYFFPDNLELSQWVSLAIGSVGCTILMFFQPVLFNYVTPSDKVMYYICSRLFLYVSGWTVMCYWRGLWDTLDFYLTVDWKNSMFLYGLAVTLTLLTKTSRNNLGLPFSLAVDTDEDLLKSDTALKVKVTKRPSQNLLNL